MIITILNKTNVNIVLKDKKITQLLYYQGHKRDNLDVK